MAFIAAVTKSEGCRNSSNEKRPREEVSAECKKEFDVSEGLDNGLLLL
jgi:hypothetical protein